MVAQTASRGHRQQTRAKQAAAKSRHANFVCVPPIINKTPPVRARPNSWQLTSFEFSILGALLKLARAELAKKRADYAYFKGKEWAFLHEDIGAESQDAFRDKMSQVNKAAHAYFNKKEFAKVRYAIHIKRTLLLREAGLSTGANNQAKLNTALDRLTKPVGKPKTPPLHSWRARLHSVSLTVNGAWIRPRNFNRVPWPLPKGEVVQALFVFLYGIDNRNPVEPDSTASKRNSIRRGALYELVGISSKMSRRDQARALSRALDSVNRHLEKLNPRALRALDEPLPDRFEMIEFDPDSIHFRAAKPKPKPKRLRLSIDYEPKPAPITMVERWHLEDLYDRAVTDEEVLAWREMPQSKKDKIYDAIRERRHAAYRAEQQEQNQIAALMRLKGEDSV